VHHRECRADLARLLNDERLDLHTQAGGFSLDLPLLLGRESGDSPDFRQGVLQKLKSLASQLASQMAEASDVPTRPGQAGDQAVLLGIGDRDEYDRYRRGRPLQNLSQLVRADQDDIDMLPH
jgi:hypothetical protein